MIILAIIAYVIVGLGTRLQVSSGAIDIIVDYNIYDIYYNIYGGA